LAGGLRLSADVTVAGILPLRETVMTPFWRPRLLTGNMSLADPVLKNVKRFGRLYA